MVYGKHILIIIMTACISIGCVITAMADDSVHEEWMPVIPKPLGSETVEQPYEWNENDNMAAQARGLTHNLFKNEEDSQIKLMATDYAMIMTGVREPQGILEDGNFLIGVYYGEFDESAVDKISVLGEYPLQTECIRENQTAVYTDQNELLDETAFQKNFDDLRRLCDID